jgi:hypothetical protein
VYINNICNSYKYNYVSFVNNHKINRDYHIFDWDKLNYKSGFYGT